MKKLLGLLLAAALLLFAPAALAEHEHTWGQWTAAADGSTHTASCVENDGGTMTVKHYNFTATVNGDSARVCAICGAATGAADNFALVSDASATPVNANPGNQRGALVVRCLNNPFAADESILCAISMAYEWNGGLATFKNRCKISVPLAAELPEHWKLVRVSGASGDDSVQTAESWIDMEAAYENGVLSFETKTPALYLVVAQ